MIRTRRPIRLELDARQHGGVVPMTMTVFPDEYYRAPRSWVEAAYPKVVYFSQTRRIRDALRGIAKR